MIAGGTHTCRHRPQKRQRELTVSTFLGQWTGYVEPSHSVRSQRASRSDPEDVQREMVRYGTPAGFARPVHGSTRSQRGGSPTAETDDWEG
jgi:hypothetical protein